MKINFILPAYSWKPSGGYKVVYGYANYLIERGHDVSLIFPRRLGNFKRASNFKTMILSILERYVRPKISWFNLNERIQLHYVQEPITCNIPDGDAVISTFWPTADYVNSLPDCKGRKFYLIQHYEVWSATKDQIDNTFKLPMRKIVVSRWLYEIVIKSTIKNTDILYLPNATDASIYKITRAIERRGDVIGFIYSPVAFKGGDFALKVLSALKKDCLGVEVLCFGTTARPSFFPKWIKYYRNPNQKVIVDEIYNRCSIFLCTSQAEGWYLPATEAMACGCALVSTDIAGIKDYAKHDETALLSPFGDFEGMVTNIQALLNNKSNRYRISINGSKKVQEFSWQDNTIKLEKYLYESHD